MSKQLILCDCLGTQTIDRNLISDTCGVECSQVHSNLCGKESAAAAAAITTGEAVIACIQEHALFEELAEDLGVAAPQFVDIRDRAGWSENSSDTGPKMAALIADALRPQPQVRALDVVAEGLCLILGKPEIALRAAVQLSDTLSVTVLLADPTDVPIDRSFDVVIGRLAHARGSLGGIELRIDALQMMETAGRGAFGFTEPRDGGISQCDLILDLTGDTALFPAPHKRDGYLRADPGDPRAVAASVFEAGQYIGTFEKPLYLRLEEHLCAHSRAGQAGCSNCLDICPTGAISPDGDHVAVDPLICAGCGACSALCPSGAITYDHPPTEDLFRRIYGLADVFRKAGGTQPRLLISDGEFGSEMISLAARFGAGLPADVIPLEVATVSGFGHAEMLASLASGFVSVHVLLSPGTDRTALDRELALAQSLAGNCLLELLDVNDPDLLSAHLYALPKPDVSITPVLPLGSRRQVARLAAKTLSDDAQCTLQLPDQAPFGAVEVNPDACTLCLSCASLCPSGALGDNPDMPQLRFQEDACLQCRLCSTVCPENALTLRPQMNLSDAAFEQRVLHEEEPYACIECGALFGVKSTVEKIVEKLAGKHAMFEDSEAGRVIRMCDDCRVKAKFHSTDNPFEGSERPRTRMTDDYLNARKDH